MTTPDRAGALERNAETYEQQAQQREQQDGPGTYVDTLRGMAAQRRESAQWLRDHTPGGAA